MRTLQSTYNPELDCSSCGKRGAYPIAYEERDLCSTCFYKSVAEELDYRDKEWRRAWGEDDRDTRYFSKLMTEQHKNRELQRRVDAYEKCLTAVMPPDYGDWHENSKEEWPEVAALTITSLRESEDFFREAFLITDDERTTAQTEIKQLRAGVRDLEEALRRCIGSLSVASSAGPTHPDVEFARDALATVNTERDTPRSRGFADNIINWKAKEGDSE